MRKMFSMLIHPSLISNKIGGLPILIVKRSIQRPAFPNFSANGIPLNSLRYAHRTGSHPRGAIG